MKKLLFILLYSLSLFSSDLEFNLKQFASLVSHQNNVNIIIEDSLKNQNFTFYLQKDKNKIMLEAFRKMLYLKHLELNYDYKNNFYFIIKHKKKDNNFYTIKLNSLSFKDIQKILKQFRNVTFSYISSSNSLVLHCSKFDYKRIKKVISDNDIVPTQFKLKIMVIETNLNDVKERGVQINTFLSGATDSVKYFFDILMNKGSSSPISTLSSSSMVAINGSLKFLNDLGVTTVKSSPTVLVQSDKRISFSAVNNVPYLTTKSSVNGASQSQTDSIEYKDIGLKVDMLPKVVNDIIFIDLNFVIENLLDRSSLTPSSTKRQLKNSFQLKKGQVLFLSGFVQDEKSTSSIGFPILMKIPYLGQMFRYDNTIHTKKTLSIMIQVI